MKKIVAVLLALAVCAGACFCFAGCDQAAGTKTDNFVVAVCQLMEHESLDKATQGFQDALKAEMDKAGKKVTIDVQVAGGVDLCTTVANATTTIPVLGTSVTDYNDTFKTGIPSNVTGTSDAVPFAEQAQMMIDSLGLVAGDQVGVIYCTNESNSVVQYNAVKALFEEKGIAVKAYTFSETTELQALVTTAATESKAIYVPSDNTVADNDSVVGTICNEKKVPVYTSYGGKICYASLAIDYYQLGYETGVMAAQILLGEKKPADIAVKTLTPTVSYNKELCGQLGITVPEN